MKISKFDSDLFTELNEEEINSINGGEGVIKSMGKMLGSFLADVYDAVEEAWYKTEKPAPGSWSSYHH